MIVVVAKIGTVLILSGLALVGGFIMTSIFECILGRACFV